MTCGLIISFSLLLTVANAVTFKLSPDHNTVFAGENANFYITLKNDGTRSLSNVVISLNMPEELGGQRNITVQSISPASTYTRIVEIVTHDTTELGEYPINATVHFGGEAIDYHGVTLELVQYPITVYYHFVNQNMKAGEQNSLIVDVKNIGSNTLTSLDVNLDYPSGFITNMTRNIHIPEVAPNLEIRQEFVFIAPSDASGDYHIGIGMTFRDADGVPHSLQKYATVNVASSPTFGWLETLLTIIIVILIGLILLGKAK